LTAVSDYWHLRSVEALAHGRHQFRWLGIVAAVTVLFVEDETPVRNVVIRMLTEKGFRVFAAADAYDAVRILAAHHVDLLFTDVVMPGMDGVQLARQAKVMQPAIKVLFATGYAQRAAERQAMRLGRILFKPLRQAELIREVEMLLGTV
jgi:CheY-like chemotaxis protein